MKKFTNNSMYEIYTFLKNELENNSLEEIKFIVLNPDVKDSSYAGEFVYINDKKYIYRSYKAWIDLAQKLYCKMLTPILKNQYEVILHFKKLKKQKSFHNEKIKVEEKYGSASEFFRINKNEEPEFLISFLEVLKDSKLQNKKRVLNLGVNNGEEFDLIKKSFSSFDNIEFVGVDFSSSAIAYAKQRFKDNKNVKFYTQDINLLDELNLGEFDLIISIGTLQSSTLNFNEIFMNIVQKYLKKDGSMILGFPNSRWMDGEIIYGAKAPNYPFSEMSLLFKDAFFCKKYLQQKKFRVTLRGKYYIFLTATSIRKN